MVRSKKSTSTPTSSSPLFSSPGAFHPLAIENLSSLDLDHPPSSSLSSSSKKARAKQRARDRARKSLINNDPLLSLDPLVTQSSTTPNVPSIPSTHTNSHLPHLTSHPSSSSTPNILIHPISPLQPSTHPQLNPDLNPSELVQATQSDSTQNLHSLTSLQPNISPATSNSASAINSITTSPSTSDLDDDDDDHDDDNGNEHDDVDQAESASQQRSLVEKPVLPSLSTDPSSQSASASAPPMSINDRASSPATVRLSASGPGSTPLTAAFPLIKPTRAPSPKAPSLASASNPSNEDGQYGADHAPGKKWQSVVTRVIWSLVMVGGFIGLMTLGHVYLIVLVFVIQLSVFREVSNLFEVGYKASAREHAKKQASSMTAGHHTLSLAAKERKRLKDDDKNRWSKVMSWYFFCVVNYFLYGESIIYYFKHIVFIDAYLLPFARHHRFISLLLYLIGFLAFVTNLDRGHLRRQFGLFSWIHMSLLLIVASGQFMVNNILEGLIWFWVPASLVIMNDVAAYVFGMLFGKHQLIKLSPKKTVEGFVGGYFTTVIFGVLWGSVFMGWNYMICPVRDLGMTAFSDVQCVPNTAFVWRAYTLPGPLVDLLHVVPGQIYYTPFQLHCLVLGTFAGLVAPFGGFFASGFKRAFNVKDFGDTIPGHGGLTDRFDCQFIMGLFTYFYYTSMVREQQYVSVGSVMEMIGSALDDGQQVELFYDLKRALVSKGLLM